MKTLLVGAIALVIALTCCTPAHAATGHRENVLRGFCAATVKTSCVNVMDNDEGVLQVRDRKGHRHTFRSSAAALRYLRHHAPACREEDSPRCYWDARSAGNGVGWSFIVVGGHREGTGSLFYLRNLD